MSDLHLQNENEQLHQRRPKPKLHIPLKTLTSSNQFSPICRNSAIYSPVTDLSMSLGELNAGLSDTPKRRLSLSSVGNTPASIESKLCFDYDASCCSMSPCSFDSPAFLRDRVKLSSVNHPVMVPYFGDLNSPCVSPDKIFSSPPNPKHKQTANETSPHINDDENSHDSGLGDKDTPKDDKFHFAEPVGPAPRRTRLHNEDTCSPKHYSPGPCQADHSPVISCFQSPFSGIGGSPVCLSRSSLTGQHGGEETDDGFLDIIEAEEYEGDNQHELRRPVPHIPQCMAGLLSAPMVRPDEHSFTPPKRRIENRENEKPRLCSRRGLFRSPSEPKFVIERAHSFDARQSLKPRTFSKRVEPPTRDFTDTPVQTNKRRRSLVYEENPVQQEEKKLLTRCHSETEAMIKSALNKGDTEPDLIGDFSKPYCLPVITGKHSDLKSIAPESLAALIRQEYSHIVEKFIIIDSRYPYEFDGGHIQDAKNLYKHDEVLAEFMNSTQHHNGNNSSNNADSMDSTQHLGGNNSSNNADSNDAKRTILIFHCEFSSERGPKLLRFLRKRDRESNKEHYPSLHYPEIYLLDGGYKNFFEKYPEYCNPHTYKPMLHKDHSGDLKHFRAKSKSWAGDNQRSRISFRTGLKF